MVVSKFITILVLMVVLVIQVILLVSAVIAEMKAITMISYDMFNFITPGLADVAYVSIGAFMILGTGCGVVNVVTQLEKLMPNFYEKKSGSEGIAIGSFGVVGPDGVFVVDEM